MQATSPVNKTVFIGIIVLGMLFALGASITTVLFVFNSAIAEVKHSGVGGRMGFVLILFDLVHIAFWAFTGFKFIKKKSWTPESYTLVKAFGAFMILFTFFMCLIIHGQGIQILYLTQDFFDDLIEFQVIFVSMGDGSVSLLSLAMVCSILFEFYFILWRSRILASSNSVPQPDDMYAPPPTNHYAQPTQTPYIQPQPAQTGYYTQPQSNYQTLPASGYTQPQPNYAPQSGIYS